MRLFQYVGMLLVGLVLAACGSNGTSQAVRNAPKGAGSWKPLGNVNNGNIVVSYDAGSLKKNGNLAWLRDRKIVINPQRERYSDTPYFKVAVSDWEFNCKNHSFRLTAVQFLDDKGKIVSQERYTTNPIPPMPIQRGTMADRQFAVACR